MRSIPDFLTKNIQVDVIIKADISVNRFVGEFMPVCGRFTSSPLVSVPVPAMQSIVYAPYSSKVFEFKR